MKPANIKRFAECAWMVLILAIAAVPPTLSRAADEPAGAASNEPTAAETAEVAEDLSQIDGIPQTTDQAAEEAEAASATFAATPETEIEIVTEATQEAENAAAEETEAPEPAATEEPEADSEAMVVVPVEDAQPGRAVGSTPTVNRQEYVTIGGNSHLLQNETANEMVTIMGNAIVDGRVRNECVTILGNVTINGSVGNEVVCILGTVTLGPGAVVDGEIVSVGGQIVADPTAIVRGEKVSVPVFGGMDMPSFEWLGQLVTEGFALGAMFPFLRTWAWLVGGILLLINLAFYLIFRRPIDACAQTLDRKPAIAFVSGVLVFVLFGPLVFLLLVSVVGILIVPFLFAGALIATICGVVAVYRYTGGQMRLQSHPILAMLVGNLLFTILYGVPVIGIAVWMLTGLMGVGAAAAALIDSMRSESGSPPKGGRQVVHRPKPPPVAPGGVPAPSASASAAAAANPGAAGVVAGEGVSSMGSAEAAASAASATGATAAEVPQLPPPIYEAVRVGFWPRLGATALDFLLIMGLLAFLNIQFLFPYLWLAYFIAFWSWRATTIGGIVLNLRIERMDGRGVDFGVAAVRALASIFSLMPVGLGFMWASWDEERQSWHDKIAGTTVVKLPRGQPLL